jgi:acyl carrier protein
LRADVRDRIVASGGEVVVLNANVAELSAMQRVVAETYRRFGTLHGVIHGAGIVGADGYAEIKDCTREHAEKHFNAKARGARVLETVLDGKAIDFCMLLSSLTAVLGGIGQVAYTSANIYLDTFARAHNRRSRTPWLSVDWDVWRVDADHWSDPALGATLRDLGTTPAEATGLLDRLLARRGEGTIVVSTGDLASRIDQWIGLRSVHKERADRSHVMNAVSDSGDDAITDETERRIAKIWARVLGLSSVTRDDHFARLGGHSLLAVSIVSELRRTFQLDLPIRVLFDVPTVAQLADYIKAQLIAEIDALSDDDAERLASTSS